ncbi:neuronal acetylcholine receptor subunit alpha-6-like [Hydractinia symbiolongicarpus]|uniref:neuronal acetylcholine receptor subunit alpha-6-like n=1 Tax=Hydractinia symbiolongicarpus TaxID=13093 RepID=UPI00254CF2E5|nr:neuronal acetylcholine receptor subunit alpha-6-like [Hydractinia symbiolongicarpus]
MKKWQQVLFFVYIVQFVVKTSGISSPESRLRDDLLETKAYQGRPVTNVSNPMKIIVGLEIAQLIDVSTTSQTLVLTGFLRKQWNNSLLFWNPQDYNGLQTINIDEVEGWTPEIVIYTSVNTNTGSGKAWSSHDIKTQVTLKHDGTTTWLTPIAFKSSCIFEVVDFPYDQQHCVIEFGPWTEDSSKVICEASTLPITTSQYVPSGEWDIESARQETLNVKYPCCEHPFSLLKVHLHLKRKPLYYQFNLLLPCVFLVVCMLAGHWIPPQSGERIALGITIALTYVVMLHVTSGSLPRSSETSTITKIYNILICEVCLSIFGSIYILLLFHRGDAYLTWIPGFLEKRYLPKSLWKSTLISEGIYEENPSDENQVETIQLSSVNMILQNYHRTKLETEKVRKRNVELSPKVKDILGEIKFLNDGEYDGAKSNRLAVRSIYAAEIYDRALFWLFLIGSILTFALIAIVHY